MTDAHNKMKFIKTADQIELTDWRLFPLSEDSDPLTRLVMKGIAAQVTSSLRTLFDKDPPLLWLPFLWWSEDSESGDGIGGPAPSDPLMIYVTIPLGEDEDANCTYGCSLEGAIDDLIDGHVNPQTEMVEDKEARALCAKVSARLRELAQKVDDACQEGQPE